MSQRKDRPPKSKDRRYEPPPPGHRWIYRPYITLPDGTRRYPKNASVFKIPVPIED